MSIAPGETIHAGHPKAEQPDRSFIRWPMPLEGGYVNLPIDLTHQEALHICTLVEAWAKDSEPLDERVERLEEELVEAQAAVERKRQEDGP